MSKGKDPDESENGSVSDDCETVITGEFNNFMLFNHCFLHHNICINAALIGLTDFGVKNGKASDFDSGIGRTISNKTRESIASISQFSEVNRSAYIRWLQFNAIARVVAYVTGYEKKDHLGFFIKNEFLA